MVSFNDDVDLNYEATYKFRILYCAVVCLGTEDRVSDPSKIVAANSVVIPFVTFPGAEIKDLIVHDPSTTALPAAPAKQNQRPPQQQQQQQRQQQQRNNNPPRPPANNNNNNRRPQNQNNNAQNNSAPREQVKREPRVQNNDGGAAGTGAHLLKLREKKAPDATGGAQPETAGEFDFNAGLAVFKKDDVLATVAGESQEKELKYKKDDFFDMLSSDNKSGAEGRKARMSASEERNLNQDTFGAIALQGNNRRYYGGRGGGGGRGRGAGRGRGRGSYGNGGVSA